MHTDDTYRNSLFYSAVKDAGALLSSFSDGHPTVFATKELRPLVPICQVGLLSFKIYSFLSKD